MRIILDLDEVVLGKLQFKADTEKRSRKNYMEVLLQNAANSNNPTTEKLADYNFESDTKKPQPPKIEVPQVNQFDAYALEINGAKSHYDLKIIVDSLNADASLGRQDKVRLNQFATQVQQQKGLYND